MTNSGKRRGTNVATVHDAMIVLTKNFRVKSANNSICKKLGVTEEKTEGVLLYDIGNKQWNIPRLREFLQDIVPKILTSTI